MNKEQIKWRRQVRKFAKFTTYIQNLQQILKIYNRYSKFTAHIQNLQHNKEKRNLQNDEASYKYPEFSK